MKTEMELQTLIRQELTVQYGQLQMAQMLSLEMLHNGQMEMETDTETIQNQLQKETPAVPHLARPITTDLAV